MNKIEYFKLKMCIEKYFRKEQRFDEQFLYDILGLIIRHRNFKSMIESIDLSKKGNEEKGASSFYSPVEKKLNIVLPNDDTDFFDYNTTILHIMLHELEHVGQHKKCLEKKSNCLETDLLSTCFRANNYLEMVQKKLRNNEIKPDEYLSVIQQMKFYEMYSEVVNKGCYELLPSERQAEINSFYYLIRLLKNICKDEDKVEMINTNYLIRKIMGYKKVDNNILAPTYELYRIILEFMNQSELQDKYFGTFDSFSENMPFDQRLYYGVNITIAEYDKQTSEIGRRLLR